MFYALAISLLLTDTCRSFRYTSLYPDSVIQKCNTARNIPGLSAAEKEVILLTNLVRYNPPLFLEKIARPFIEKEFLKTTNIRDGRKHVESLYKELKETPPMPVLKTETVLNATAASHAEYCSRTGHMGHHDFPKRFKTIREKLGHLTATENCSFTTLGDCTALYHVIGLLIDADLPETYGHRKAILDKKYQYIGVAIRLFPKNKTVLVQNFSASRSF
ncbi:MAG: CAP domain-containing protein [Chitinophagaceae bacterium]|nr:CAP domain-containing protein [Chitinophagaceae bacterium]